ncbi:MAG: Gfo/Idh/MocA family oxidoreductase [Victivallaceae bacterium]|nr:Gfo/Idh/MocA family oxidoreductase [Victivallaceae bacterium]
MKKIGFIDYFIDEFHANNYPRLIRESRFKDKFDVTLAWEMIKKEGKKPLSQWCRDNGVREAASIEQVVDESDCIVVLSPDNSEMHEELADLALRSGKAVYVDKPIAPSLAVARKLFEKAGKYNTPMMSCSALRFTPELENALRNDIGGSPIHFTSIKGGGDFATYAIHQLEMLVMLMGPGVKRVLQCGTEKTILMIMEYHDKRRASINIIPNHPFNLSIQFGDNKSIVLNKLEGYFPKFVDAMLTFFENSASLVPQEETLEIAALIEAGTMALQRPDEWVEIPR